MIAAEDEPEPEPNEPAIMARVWRVVSQSGEVQGNEALTYGDRSHAAALAAEKFGEPMTVQSLDLNDPVRGWRDVSRYHPDGQWEGLLSVPTGGDMSLDDIYARSSRPRGVMVEDPILWRRSVANAGRRKKWGKMRDERKSKENGR